MSKLLTLLITLSLGLFQRAPAQGLHGRAPGSVFRDCPDCPEMVVIPAGDFAMGSSATEKAFAVSQGATPGSVADEAPQHRVALRSFALGKYDVTRGEYAAFVRETGYAGGDGCFESGNPNSPKRAGASWRDPGFSQTDRDPVVCVSWRDARAYVAWLNGKVGGSLYRLPSESEWEYAARAGTTTRFWWGDDPERAADYAWFKGNAGARTHPVGSMPANRFGLYDMAGDVWQLTEDCYAESYATAPADGSAAEAGGDACLRSDRAAPGSTLRGCFARPPASGIPPTIGTASWGSAWPGRSPPSKRGGEAACGQIDSGRESAFDPCAGRVSDVRSEARGAGRPHRP
jgi:formylglycine-generating enzyme required for sulfatase activity